MQLDKSKRIGGLVINFKLGDSIEINEGELKIQVVEVKGSFTRLCFLSDREKYRIGRVIVDPSRKKEIK